MGFVLPTFPGIGTTTYTLSGTTSQPGSDPVTVTSDSDPGPGATWSLTTPAGSSATLSGSGASRAYTPDYPGLYVVTLTEGGASTSHVCEAGTPDGGLVIHDVDCTALADDPWAADGPVTIGTIGADLVNLATMASLGIVSGAGVRGICQVGSDARLLTTTEGLWEHSGRGGRYVMGCDVTISGMAGTYDDAGMFYRSPADSIPTVACTVRYASSETRMMYSSATGQYDVPCTTTGDHAIGLALRGYDAEYVNRSGSWPADLDWSAEAHLGDEGSVLDLVAPGGTATQDWKTDVQWFARWKSSTGTPTITYTRMWVVWYPA